MSVPSDPSSTLRRPTSFSVRAIAIGTLLAIAVNLLTPYNDYVVANTFVVGSYLPLALTLTIVLVVMVGNGLCHCVSPRKALRTGELAVILMMLLVSCSVPSQGLMRGLIPTLAAPFYEGTTNPTFWSAFTKLQMPAWLYPVSSIADGRGTDAIRYFSQRVPDDVAIPYGAWAKALGAWAIYLSGFALTIVSLAWLLRAQWAENERLPFPLAQLQLSLIEPPEPGRAMNALFRSKGFWIATAAVALVHTLSALHLYDIRWPEVYRSYDLRPKMADVPWSYLPDSLRTSPIYFTFIGVTFFIRTRTAFSIWATYVVTQFYVAGRAAAQVPVPVAQTVDQHLGACIAFSLGMVWIGRKFFGSALMGALGFTRSGDRRPDANHVLAMRGLFLGVAIMFGWLVVIGASWWMAVVTIAFVTLAHVVTARMVAETGIPYVRSQANALQLVTAMPASSLSAKDVFIAGNFSLNGAFPTREGLMGLAQHGMQIVETADPSTRVQRRRFLGVGTLIAWTLAVSFVAAAWSSVTCYHSYATPISPHSSFTILNQDVMTGGHTKANLVTPLVEHASGAFAAKGYDPAVHVGVGFGITTVLQVATWRFASWPLLPVGYLMSGTTFMNLTWFSILIGWGIKVVLIRVGGHKLLEASRPVFIGMIFGESLAAAGWMVVNLILAVNGFDYFPYSALPT